MTSYEILPAREEKAPQSTKISPTTATAQDPPRHGGVSAVTVVVMAAAICIALLAFVNLASAGETSVLQGVDSLGRVR